MSLNKALRLKKWFLAVQMLTLGLSSQAHAFSTTLPNRQNGKQVVPSLKQSTWTLISDETERNSGSGTLMSLSNSAGNFTGNFGFEGRLGSVPNGPTGPVAFARASTQIKVSRFVGDYLSIAPIAQDPNLVISVILQTESSKAEGISFVADIKALSTPKVGLYGGGTVLIPFEAFRPFRRGRPVEGLKFDKNKGSFTVFGLEVARSKQRDAIRFEPFIPFKIQFAGDIGDVIGVAADEKMNVLNNVEREIQRNRTLAASRLSPEEFRQLEAAVAQLNSLPQAEPLSLDQFNARFADAIVTHTLGFPSLLGGGIFTRNNLTRFGEEIRQKEFSGLPILAEITKFPSAPVSWQARLAYGMASFCGLSCVLSDSGKIIYQADQFEVYLTNEFAKYGIRSRVKTNALTKPNGQPVGLDRELIAEINGSVVFDKSPFESNVGRFSFPASLLFVLESAGGLQSERALKIKDFFKEITVPIFAENALPGWRVWQRTFAGTGETSIFDVGYWKKITPYQVN